MHRLLNVLLMFICLCVASYAQTFCQSHYAYCSLISGGCSQIQCQAFMFYWINQWQCTNDYIHWKPCRDYECKCFTAAPKRTSVGEPIPAVPMVKGEGDLARIFWVGETRCLKWAAD